ncbi:hypothetical protein Pmar_PMAR016524 [Perkinsus marinus ATCC 50983]|uniref:Uncharacterized protein n=1 Tax=Perkinsus marinus (strain ATCC 50983 / TXsc) TaxID=423536 RepID=C5KEV3_PERM5|nr:hypothetical protein Pmar_PMAR016524 [Perkinsus marinus ATCC 50983]EER16994.1 hypothetical protein Pmar_PMAR016524 [Perkinsus marinus ATCC 50983]|eukprot:XP_002785198.1 hypothetical protein Pmar_PMAR016524 [Perkinsus marinus ATCC 50983]
MCKISQISVRYETYFGGTMLHCRECNDGCTSGIITFVYFFNDGCLADFTAVS